MSNELTSKRLSDDELEAVAGGATPPTIDPSALAGLMHSTVSTAIGGGGAYTMETPAPAHTDSGTPTITGQTNTTVSGSSIFGNESLLAPQPVPSSSLGPVATGTVTISGNLHIDLPPGSVTPDSPGITVMQLPQEGQFTKITPTVVGDEAEQPAPVGGTSSINYMGTV